MDNMSKVKRSKIMSSISSKNTKPEMIVRKLLHAHGYRYTIHKKTLPGKPDLYFKKYNAVILINGCFWHQHANCKLSHIPESNTDYWIPKLKRNIERDHENIEKLRNLGLRVLVLWECEINSTPPEILLERISQFLQEKAPD